MSLLFENFLPTSFILLMDWSSCNVVLRTSGKASSNKGLWIDNGIGDLAFLHIRLNISAQYNKKNIYILYLYLHALDYLPVKEREVFRKFAKPKATSVINQTRLD